MKTLYVIKHVPFEGPGFIEYWAKNNSIEIKTINAWEMAFPHVDEKSGVLLMGGPMGVNDGLEFISRESKWVDTLIKNGNPVLGICLGAQIIAKTMGASVYKGPEKEIGWFPIFFDGEDSDEDLKNLFNDEEMVFHWHGEVFDLPKGATRLFFNDISRCQGFYMGKVAGFQFHMETTAKTASLLIENCGDDLEDKGEFIQSKDEILSKAERFVEINEKMDEFLNWWAFK